MLTFFDFLLHKDAVATDVHATRALGDADERKRKPRKVSPTAKLPVTDMTAAALAEAGQRPIDKVGARHSRADMAMLQAIHDHACGLGASCLPDGSDGGQDDVERDADWSIPLTVAKADPDKQLIFGWASIVEKGGKPVVDKQGDIIPVEELEKAAYDFVLHSRQNDDRHIGGPTGRCVESMVFTKDKQQALGIDLGKVGWWVGFKVDDDDLWAAHKRGERPEFSIGGGAVRESV
jgi:hypothetical protein